MRTTSQGLLAIFGMMALGCGGTIRLGGTSVGASPAHPVTTTNAERSDERPTARTTAAHGAGAEQKSEIRSVVKQFTQFSGDDSMVLGKVREAFKLADKSMFYRTHTARGGHKLRYTPYPLSGGSYQQILKGVNGWNKEQPGVGKYGYAIDGGPESSLTVRMFDDYTWSAPDGTSGLVWEVGDHHCAFVSVDGHRFQGPCEALEPGAADPASWLSSATFPLVEPGAIEVTSKAGGLPAATTQRLTALAAKWTACRDRAWAPGLREVRANDAANITAATRANRRDAIVERYGNVVWEACKNAMIPYDDALVAVGEAREREHKSLFAEVKTLYAAKP